jgi:hypothetical protein
MTDIQQLIDRLQTARDEVSNPRAKMHEYTSEDLETLLDDVIFALQEKTEIHFENLTQGAD